jgi:nitric oxide reductase subunit C
MNRYHIFKVFFAIFLVIQIVLRSYDALALDSMDGDADPGKVLVEKIGCLNCHAIDGKGGTVAPDLSHVHERLQEEWLVRFLKNPYVIRPLGYIPYSDVQMPNLRLTDKEAEKIAHYLSTLKKGEIERRAILALRLNNPEGRKADIDKGRILFASLPCLNCHTIMGGKRRLIAPDLSDIGTRLQPEFLYLWLENPQAFEPRTMLPNFGFKDPQHFPLTRFLMSLKSDLPPVPDETPTGRLPFGPMRVAKAERFFGDLCIRCHSLDGQGGEIGPDLSYEGDKVNRRWLFQYLKNPYRIRPLGFEQNPLARMPKLRLNDDELMTMTEFISTLKKGRNLNLPMAHGMMILKKNKPAMSRERMIKMGKMVINIKGCTGCHRIGKLSLQRVTIGPDLTTVGDRLKEGWIYSWIKDPQKYRPETLMPNMGLTDMQARSVAAYLSERKQVFK